MTTKSEFLLTGEGVQALKDELHNLSTTKRSEIAARLKDAKDDGDLSENSMYDAARDQQSFVEGRISEIEYILKHAVLIDGKTNGDKVDVGSVVHVELESGQQKYQ